MKDKDPKYNLMLIFALVIVLAFDIFFVYHKEGYHTIEILSYELSDSEFTPVRLTERLSDEGPVWMSSYEITEHVAVSGNNPFVAIPAYLNSVSESDPPFYYMMLNVFSAVRAVFSYGTLSPWPGCVLNMFFMMCSMIVISSFFRNVVGKKFLGPVTALFYGLSPAGIDTVLLIGMYGAAAFFGLAFAYLVLRRIADGRDFRKRNKKIIFVTVLGFLTSYHTCIFFFFLILTSVIYLVSVKKTKNALYLIRTMIISAVLGVAAYPFVFGDISRAVRGFSFAESTLAGFADRVRVFTVMTAERTGWSGGGAVMMLVFVLIAAAVAVLTKKMRFSGPALFVSVCGYILTESLIAPGAEDRYLMPVFPFVMIIWIMGLGFIISYIAERFLKDPGFRKVIYAGVLFIWTVSCLCLVPVISPVYLCEGYSGQLGISENYSSYNAVIVYSGADFYRNVPELMNYDNCFLLREDEAGIYDERLASMNAVILIEGEGVDKDAVLRRLGNEYGFTSLTFLMEDGVFGDRVCLLSK